jgi:hypothetical protein
MSFDNVTLKTVIQFIQAPERKTLFALVDLFLNFSSKQGIDELKNQSPQMRGLLL